MSRKAALVLSISLALGLLAAPALGAEQSKAGLISLANASTVNSAALPASRDTLGAAANRAASADTLIFTAPPRESPDAGKEIYGPVADYLSQAIGKKIEYRHPGTWGVYRTEMVKGTYDIVFDGPHFNSYRAEKLSHNILAKIAESHEFVVIVKKEQSFADPKQMSGRTFCAHAPPNLGTLVLLAQYENPSRQPVILSTDGWNNIYQGVASGKCAGGVLPMLNLKKLDKEGKTKVIFKSQPYPNQAFSVGPRLSKEDQAKITAALFAPEAKAPTAKLREAFKVGEAFVPANNQEYAGLAVFLRNEWGYY